MPQFGSISSPFLLICLLLLLPTMLHAFLTAPTGGRLRLLRIAATATTTRRFSASTAGASDSAQQQPIIQPSPEALATFARIFPSQQEGADLRPVVLFDGVCAFCNRGIDTVLRLDVNRKLRFAPLQSELGRHLMETCGRDPNDLSSMCVVEADRRLSLKSDAAIRIAEVAAPHPALGAAFERAARLLLPQGVRDRAYDTVAENRYSILGKRDTCRLPDPGDDRFLA